MLSHEGWQDHNKFEQLAALVNSGALTPAEWSEWKRHLQNCQECQEASRQYLILTTEGVPTLAAIYAERGPQAHWDQTETRNKLLARVKADQRSTFRRSKDLSPVAQAHFLRRLPVRLLVPVALASCLVVAVGTGAYRLGSRAQRPAVLAAVPQGNATEQILAQRKSLEELLAVQAKKLARQEEDTSQKEQEVGRLRSTLRVVADHADELVTANSQSEAHLQTLAQQRDSLETQLRDANQAYQNVRNELANLRSERDNALSRAASLEARLDELTAANRDQERRLKDTEQYLASDRDIRELMGARKLYIADVFDVDSGSRTRKPFGRVFYTQGKSLVFYAFDLDRQPGVVNASTFQVWGQRETPPGEQALPMNLGILYMDNESNRRWVMRFDDPKQLAAIDAVFVTVEPRGGSHKPTSKPFLYALLRNEANHP